MASERDHLSVAHPHRQGLVVIGGLALLSLVPIVVGGGLALTGQRSIGIALLLIGALFLFIFGVAVAVAWWSGRRQVERIREFLASDRPLIQWSYEPELWAEIQRERWETQLGDGRVQVGCLTIFFALAGVVIGIIVGVDLGRWVWGGLLGLGGGAVIGAAMGAVVAATTQWAARRAREGEPETVALGRREMVINGQYVRREGPGPLMAAARILREETPPLLVLDLRLSGDPAAESTQRWEVVIPPDLVDDVSAVLREESERHGRRPDTL